MITSVRGQVCCTADSIAASIHFPALNAGTSIDTNFVLMLSFYFAFGSRCSGGSGSGHTRELPVILRSGPTDGALDICAAALLPDHQLPAIERLRVVAGGVALHAADAEHRSKQLPREPSSPG